MEERGVFSSWKHKDPSAIDLIGVLKTMMHYDIVSGIEQRKVSISSDKRFVSLEIPE